MRRNRAIGLTICAALAAASIGTFAAEKEPVVIAPAAAEETVVGTPRITVNGEEVDFSRSGLSSYMFETNGVTMVPVRAVAEKMGLSVGWDGENQAVTVGNDVWEVRAYIGEDLYSGVTKIEGAVGMTAPQSYGAAPVLFEDRTFVPAKMFELLDYNFHAVGQFASFTKSGVLIEENGQEYSNDTLIVSVSENADKTKIADLFSSKDMEIVYESDMFNMYTVKLSAPMSAEELDECIAELEKNENVVSVSKNYIMHLD